MLASLRKLKLNTGLGWRFNYVAKVTINGAVFKAPYIFNQHVWTLERWMTEALPLVLAGREGAFLDVGTNTGQTLLNLRSVDPEREWVGFEPNPLCTAYLYRLIRANGFKGCKVVPVGLFDKTEIAVLGFDFEGESDPAASLVIQRGNRRDEKYVPVFRYDDMETSLGVSRVAAVKIDVEGAELEAMSGMRGMLERERPPVIFEVLSVRSEAQRKRTEGIEKLARDIGYTIMNIMEVGDRVNGIRRVASLASTEGDPWPRSPNYLMAPEEMCASLERAG